MAQGADMTDLFTTEYFPCFRKMHFPAILGVKKTKLSVPTMVEHIYKFRKYY